jgi:hypothetical protein
MAYPRGAPTLGSARARGAAPAAAALLLALLVACAGRPAVKAAAAPVVNDGALCKG